MENTSTTDENDVTGDFYISNAIASLERLLHRKQEEIKNIQNEIENMNWENIANNEQYCRMILESIELLEKEKFPGYSRQLIIHHRQMLGDLRRWINKYHD